MAAVVQAAEARTKAYLPQIDLARTSQCIAETDIPKSVLPYNEKYVGKVRDTYTCDDCIVLVSTDRQSAFDRSLALVPFKGSVLNQTSAWWFDRTRHITANHVLGTPDPNVCVGKKVEIFSIEFVMRGYLTGSTSTSIWKNYEKGVRAYCGHTLPDGLTKNQKLPMGNILTPTTKDAVHDELISAAEVVSSGRMTQQEWDACHRVASELFAYGQKVAAERGLILVDTKYELGKDADGNIVLADEIHTPDSSRYWIAESYEERMAEGKEPESVDKEFLRRWFAENCDPYKDEKLPEAPAELVNELSRRYIMLYEMITGQDFVFPDALKPVNERLSENIGAFMESRRSVA